MKKLIIYILLIISISASAGPTTAYAREYEPAEIPKPSTLPGPSPKDIFDKDKSTDEGQELPGVRRILTEQILPRFAIYVVGLVGGVALLFLVISGVRFAMAYGNEEAVEKAKHQATYSVVGLIIALLAYTIVTIIINLQFKGETGKGPATKQRDLLETIGADPDAPRMTPEELIEVTGADDTNVGGTPDTSDDL